MFGCSDVYHWMGREGDLLAGLRTYLSLSRTTLTQPTFWYASQISATLPSGIADLRVIVACGSWKHR